MRYLFLSLSLFLLGCSSKEASHLPSLLEFPVAVISTAVENTRYNSRRNRVKQYVIAEYESLQTEVRRGRGTHLTELMRITGIKTSQQAKAQQALRRDYNMMFHNTMLITEAVMRAFGSQYMSSQKTKRMNGVSYSEGYRRVERYIKSYFIPFRIAMKQGSDVQLNHLADLLHIRDSVKREKFITMLRGKYNDLYIDTVVVGFMVRAND